MEDAKLHWESHGPRSVGHLDERSMQGPRLHPPPAYALARGTRALGEGCDILQMWQWTNVIWCITFHFAVALISLWRFFEVVYFCLHAQDHKIWARDFRSSCLLQAKDAPPGLRRAMQTAVIQKAIARTPDGKLVENTSVCRLGSVESRS